MKGKLTEGQGEHQEQWRDESYGVQKYERNSMIHSVLIYRDGSTPYELLWDLTDEIDCAETEAVGLLRSLSPFISFGFPLSLSIASWHISLNHSSSGNSLATKVISGSKC